MYSHLSVHFAKRDRKLLEEALPKLVPLVPVTKSALTLSPPEPVLQQKSLIVATSAKSVQLVNPAMELQPRPLAIHPASSILPRVQVLVA